MITKNLKLAVDFLLKNNVVAIPTETVYGLAGNAFNEAAIKRIFTLKKRPFHNPLIVHIKSISELNTVATDIPPLALTLAKSFWPGPLTLVLKKHTKISNWVTGGKETVGVRIPNHPVALSLLEQLPFPLAAPSANPFGSISPTTPSHVNQYFKKELILDGGFCKKGIESTIIGFENEMPVLYRHGAISIHEIEEKIGKLKIGINSNKTPEAPGMLAKHYAPNTKIILTSDVEKELDLHTGKKIGLLVFNKKIKKQLISQQVLSKKSDFKEAAKNLYHSLHILDKENLDLIIAELLPNEGLGMTINDRLQRAVH